MSNMPLTDSDYNAFASSLVSMFSKRAKGVDANSARLVNLRPADHVLAGFLTPRSDTLSDTVSGPDEAETADADTILAEDLPRDSSYEQTAIGLEWLAPTHAFNENVLEVQSEFFVYVRRAPTLAEQKEHGIWREVHSLARDGALKADNIASSTKLSRLVAVWTREHIPNLSLSISLAELRKRRRLTIDLSPQIRRAAAEISREDLFPGRRAIDIEEQNITSPEAFQAKLTAFTSDSLPLDWRAVVDVRVSTVPTEADCFRIALRIINYTDPVGPRALDYVDPNLYGVGLKVSVPYDAHRATIFQELPASFRYNREMPAIGINAQANSRKTSDRLELEIDTVPQASIPRLEPRDIPDANPAFAELARAPVPILQGILAEMRRYDAESWERRIRSLTGLERDEAMEARSRFQQEIERFDRGVQLLADSRYPLVMRAFKLMNEAMGAATSPHKNWRLFQIVFIVSQIQRLAAREYQELVREDDDSVDILWFAAGGGKTEAFLGQIVWQAFFDRLRGKNVGVTAFVRFPLRLLTFQQLQRLARALAAAELIRHREQLGGSRFSMGYFVGSTVTPNSISDDLHQRYLSEGVNERLKRVFQCPFCFSVVNVSYEAGLRLVTHSCSNSTCPGGKARLPVYVVDDDIYRFLPTVIVSTVDKLAQLGQNQRFANLFGRFNLLCHRHGASFAGGNRKICQAAGDFALGGRPENCDGEAVTFGPFHDPAPALLIQDELHLLSEELGTFDAHYETGIMELTKSLGQRPWKIIAATATIEDYEQQAWQLYLKKSRQFPGPGPEAYDSFYYSQNANRIGRLFVGVLGVGRKHTPSVTRALSLLYLELQSAREIAARNTTEAAAIYGTRQLTSEEFTQLIFLYELPLTYVLTRKGSDQVAEAIESRVKRELDELAPLHGELLTDTFNGGVDITEMIEAMERIRTADPMGDPAERIRGIVTTNIIGHGVDVDRFNVIVFAGFTRLVAEYIQASARVGRTYPGISIFAATPQSERDRSIFDRFAKFHEYLDRLVDPTAVNRWPDTALARTVPGLLCGYLMGVASHQLGKPIAYVENVQDSYGNSGAECLNDDAIVAWMLRAYGSDFAPSQLYRDRLVNRTKNAFSSIVNVSRQRGGRLRLLNKHLNAMRSLRDVDDPAYIVPADTEDEAILKRFING
jgi:hypothetical protein